MNTEAIGKWTAELRSGNRAQAKGKLHLVESDNESQCCLGVACDLFKDELDLEVGLIVCDESTRYVVYDDEDSVLPKKVADYLGFDCSNPHIVFPLNEDKWSQTEIDGKIADVSIAQLNDNGFTFEQIADIIDFFFGENN